jgi:hypothetical protein
MEDQALQAHNGPADDLPVVNPLTMDPVLRVVTMQELTGAAPAARRLSQRPFILVSS